MLPDYITDKNRLVMPDVGTQTATHIPLYTAIVSKYPDYMTKAFKPEKFPYSQQFFDSYDFRKGQEVTQITSTMYESAAIPRSLF